jgi:hypothetical protein
VGKSRDEVVARFAVGSVDGPRSAVWRLWTRKGNSDVYVAARILGGTSRSASTSRACGGSPFEEETRRWEACQGQKTKEDRWVTR